MAPDPGNAFYRQDFDDPFDFDMESYYPVNKKCNAYWTPRSVDAQGVTNGCLKMEMAESGEGRCGRRGFSLASTHAVVEFDCLSHGFTGLVLAARSKIQLRAPISGKPADDQWAHYVVPCWKLQGGTNAVSDPADRICELTIGGLRGEPGSYLLIDNILVRPPVAEETRTQKP